MPINRKKVGGTHSVKSGVIVRVTGKSPAVNAPQGTLRFIQILYCALTSRASRKQNDCAVGECEKFFQRSSPSLEIDRRCLPFPCVVYLSCYLFWYSRTAFLQVRFSFVARYHSPFYYLITCVVRRSLWESLWGLLFLFRSRKKTK